VEILVNQVGQIDPVEIFATYIIAPQLAGLIVGDNVTLTATRGGKRIRQETSSLINSLVPVGPPPAA
jgi:hypothetical protein